MRAWRVGKHGEPRGALSQVETPLPAPAQGQLRIRVAAAALGLPDVFLCRGSYPLTPALPFTPGQEAAGVVTAAGPGCAARPGDRVMGVAGFHLGHGAFAEEALLVDAYTFPAPEALPDPEAAAFVIPSHTAHLALVHRGRLAAGETLVVLGAAGGTGAAAVALGRALGARVIAVARGETRVAFCRELGAHEALDREREELEAGILERTGGRGADVIFDPVGGSAFQAALGCVAQEGRILVVGFASGRFADAPTGQLLAKNASAVGVLVGSQTREQSLAMHEDLLARHARGELRVPVGRRVAWDEIPSALADLARGRALGKVVAIAQ